MYSTPLERLTLRGWLVYFAACWRACLLRDRIPDWMQLIDQQCDTLQVILRQLPRSLFAVSCLKITRRFSQIAVSHFIPADILTCKLCINSGSSFWKIGWGRPKMRPTRTLLLKLKIWLIQLKFRTNSVFRYNDIACRTRHHSSAIRCCWLGILVYTIRTAPHNDKITALPCTTHAQQNPS